MLLMMNLSVGTRSSFPHPTATYSCCLLLLFLITTVTYCCCCCLLGIWIWICCRLNTIFRTTRAAFVATTTRSARCSSRWWRHHHTARSSSSSSSSSSSWWWIAFRFGALLPFAFHFTVLCRHRTTMNSNSKLNWLFKLFKLILPCNCSWYNASRPTAEYADAILRHSQRRRPWIDIRHSVKCPSLPSLAPLLPKVRQLRILQLPPHCRRQSQNQQPVRLLLE